MAFQVTDIQWRYSGGAGNSSPAASLGGVMSSTSILSQTGTLLGTVITGLTVNNAVNNQAGNGTLSWNSSTQYLSYTPPGSSYVYQQLISGNGVYVIGGTDGMVTVTVVLSSMPTSNKTQTVTIANATDAVFQTVTPSMSLLGSTQYRCIYVRNGNSTLSAGALFLYLYTQTTGNDDIFIGLDPAGIGNGTTTGVATTIPNQTTAPSGVTFSAPLTIATGLDVGTLGVGQSFAFWEKRVVPPGTLGYIDMNISRIGLALTV